MGVPDPGHAVLLDRAENHVVNLDLVPRITKAKIDNNGDDEDKRGVILGHPPDPIQAHLAAADPLVKSLIMKGACIDSWHKVIK